MKLHHAIMFVALLLLAWMWPAGAAHAANLTCTVSASAMNFGDVDPYTSADVHTNATVTYRCDNTSNATANFSLCLGVDDGGGGYPRQMSGPFGDSLAFDVYQPPGYSQPLGTVSGTGGKPYLISGQVGGNGTVTGTISINGSIAQGQSSFPGTYTRTMRGTVVVDKNPTNTVADCTAGNQTLPFQLTASARVTNSCTVDADPMLDFGTVASLATAVSSSTTITVRCPFASFDVGLDDGQNATAGQRNMRGMTSGDLIGYDIYLQNSTSKWGNTVGVNTENGFSFLNSPQTFTVNAKTTTTAALPTPDIYTDTVTVFVYY